MFDGVGMENEINMKIKIMIVTAAVFILTCLVGYSMIHKANVSKAVKLNVKIGEARKIKLLMVDINNTGARMSEYAAIKSNSPEPGSFLSKVVDAANSCQIKIDTMNTGSVVQDGEYKFLPCGVSFTAPYKTAMLFIRGLESGQMYTRIDNLSIEKGDSLVNVKMDASGFYYE